MIGTFAQLKRLSKVVCGQQVTEHLIRIALAEQDQHLG